VAILRRILQTRRIGHAGTLDPFATGLLVVLVGPATRLTPYLVGLHKRYTGVIRLGLTTATDDLSGEEQARSDTWQELLTDAIGAAMAGLTGSRSQVPPAYSAKHVDGERAHRRARRGEVVRLPPAQVEIHRFTLRHRDGPDVAFEAEVGSGTYLRSLARELGESLGCGAHLRELRRTAVGPFDVSESIPLDQAREGRLQLLPALEAVRHLPHVTIAADLIPRVRHGQAVAADNAPASGAVALVADDTLIGVAERRGDVLQPRVVLP
jgi:tRNA pseudouridine55 synthase